MLKTLEDVKDVRGTRSRIIYNVLLSEYILMPAEREREFHNKLL